MKAAVQEFVRKCLQHTDSRGGVKAPRTLAGPGHAAAAVTLGGEAFQLDCLHQEHASSGDVVSKKTNPWFSLVMFEGVCRFVSPGLALS